LGIDHVREANRLALGDLAPDLTLLLQLPAEEAEARARHRDGDRADRIAARGAVYHSHVAEAFEMLAKVEPHRFVRIDSSAHPDRVAAQIASTVEERLPCA